MEALGFLVLLVIFVLVVVVPIAAIVIARGARDRAEAAEQRLEALRSLMTDRQGDFLTRLSRLEARVGSAGAGKEKEDVTPPAVVVASAAVAPVPPSAPAAETVTMGKVPGVVPPTSLGGISIMPVEEVEDEKVKEEAPEPAKPAVTSTSSPSFPPPLPFAAGKAPLHPLSPVEAPVPASAYVPTTAPSLTPPPLAAKAPATPQPVARPAASAGTGPAFSTSTLEQFMGVKLFAWVGGLALFLGIVFFIKLSLEKGWISEEARVAIGFITGVALVVGGWLTNSRRLYTVLGQTLCATGVVVLYGVSFSADALHDFSWYTPMVSFGVMSAITIMAFLLAVRMDAQVVAVLGMLGGFLTPILCSTGVDRPFGLFGYIALLDLGVLAVAWRMRWLHLTPIAALGTAFMQSAWALKFFSSEGYDHGAKTWIAIAIFLFFAALFAGAVWWQRVKEERERNSSAPSTYPAIAGLIVCASALLAAFASLAFPGITSRPATLYTYTLLVNVIVMAIAWRDSRVSIFPVLAGLATFLHLVFWTRICLVPAQLPQALGVYLLFGGLYTGFVVLWQRFKAVPLALPAGWVPVLSIPLMFIPVLRFDSVSLWLWPALLLLNLMVIGFALLSRRLPAVFVSVALTMVTVAFWLVKMPPAAPDSLPTFLGVLGVFALVFSTATSVLANLILRSKDADDLNRDMAKLLPVGAAIMPFILLVMAVLQLQVPEPSLVFGMALLLCVFLLALALYMRVHVLPLAATLGVLLLEIAWHERSFSVESPVTPLLWYLGFGALFMAYPHVFRRKLEETVLPWGAAAIASAGTFGMVYLLVDRTWPNDWMGLLPAAFAVPAGLSLLIVLRRHRVENPARLSQLAWFGGLTLLFITLIFPIQFEKQWITLGWAFEGAALCWLYRRVPHPGLRGTGTALLLLAFIRLALNPAVLTYQTRSDTMLLNWQLYAYSLAAASFFLAAWWLNPPRHLMAGINLRGLFATLGTILLFLLVNIEIADAFTAPGKLYIAFEFSGNFARDMTYSIAWALFALALLVTGFAMRNAPTRYAGIVLLAITLLKLFFHDLSRIESIYRIGALIAVALIALAASFLYQRFLNKEEPSR